MAQPTKPNDTPAGGIGTKGKRYRRPASSAETLRRKRWAAEWSVAGREYKLARLRREAQ